LARRTPFRNRLEYWLVRALLAPLGFLPRRLAGGLARVYTAGLDAAVPRLRTTAMRNLALAMPHLGAEEREALAAGCFESLARVLVSVARMPAINRGNVHQWIRYEGYEHYEKALERGRGVLFATGHLGNWELSAYAHALLSAPMSVVARPLDNPLLEAFAASRRALSGNRILGRGGYLRPLVEALRANRAVGILVDQNTTADRGVFIDFFGVKACVDAGFARLAARTGAAVIPGFAVWRERERRYVLKFYEPVAMTGGELADTQAVHAALERAIREYPEQWLWIHRRWNTRPEGEPPLY
jgi:KDO2-lipid IV(A) lauroyltransferase